jgi:hypothetical protein
MTLSIVQQNRDRMDELSVPRRAQIRKNVPLPPKHKPGIAQEFPNMRAMAVGDSFEILNRPGKADLSKAVDAAVRVRAWGETKWKVRKTPNGVGVWRVA